MALAAMLRPVLELVTPVADGAAEAVFATSRRSDEIVQGLSVSAAPATAPIRTRLRIGESKRFMGISNRLSDSPLRGEC
ncbi:MAG: hypothetical protein M0015_18495 [Betaproteobacteria bacterium]|nr:hypothetical protein [Betaproteobacteria bacterium]